MVTKHSISFDFTAYSMYLDYKIYCSNSLNGSKKCEANQKQHCQQVGVTKNFDIS